ncbi:hypothetical protein HHI36_001442 [Cryptolaemus montrouzieri]|uniref:Uncharacterized protein n=1 Tax=Cryptolaemus montrouzieri TaxID=559131 RepID=A0ABD2P8G2_9CUCU
MASSNGYRPERVNVLDPNFATVVTGWYEDLLSDNSDVEPEENMFSPSDHESESEQEPRYAVDEIIPLGKVSTVVSEGQVDREKGTSISSNQRTLRSAY